MGQGAYEWWSREGACNSSSIQIQITDVFLFWWGAVCIVQSVTYFKLCDYVRKYTMAVQEIVTLESTDVQEEIQVMGTQECQDKQNILISSALTVNVGQLPDNCKLPWRRSKKLLKFHLGMTLIINRYDHPSVVYGTSTTDVTLANHRIWLLTHNWLHH